MAKKQDARDMLNQVLSIMAKDIDVIQEMEVIDGEIAGRLVKYSGALLSVVKDEDGQTSAENSRASKLTTEELAAKAQEFLRKKG